ncbi:MAG: hypothetical protein ACJ748_03200 [Flavisolibacter sp.]
MDTEEKGMPSQPFKFLKMKYLILSSFFSLSIIIVQAQNKTYEGESYTHAVGVKIFDGGGISYKQFLNGNNAAEVIGYFYTKGFRLAALYEVHNDIQGIGGLKWYYGGGAHIGFYNSFNGHSRSTVLGADGVIGIDYKFNSSPINISLDWQPSFEFGSGFGFNGSWGGLGIRYTF